MRRFSLVLTLWVVGTAWAQQPVPISPPPRIDSPNEVDKLKASCFSLKGIPDCAEELFTGQTRYTSLSAASLRKMDLA